MIPDLLGLLVVAIVASLPFLRRGRRRGSGTPSPAGPPPPPRAPSRPGRAPVQPSGETAEPYAFDNGLITGAPTEDE
jgi:hypothetical protein